jgi:hypothetical protein
MRLATTVSQVENGKVVVIGGDRALLPRDRLRDP